MSNPTCFHLSASCISSFKACPTRYRLAYREGLRLAEDTEAQRMGTNWHAIHEVYQTAVVGYRNGDAVGTDDDRPHGVGVDAHEYAFNAAIEHLNERYEEVPSGKSAEEWEVERQKLVTSFMGYLWYWQNDPVDPIISELAFDLAVNEPRTGLPLPTSQTIRVGKIDHVVSWQGMIGNVERKSTSRGIDPDSDYWDKAKKDTQVSMYALAFRDLLNAGELPEAVTQHPDYDPHRFGNTLYDVWHKPTIAPSKLTQAETKDFLETGEYRDQKFDVQVEWKTEIETRELKSGTKTVEHQVPVSITVDGTPATFEVGKTFKAAVRETPTMYAARLLSDIYERPEFYFARKEIARTDQDLRKFRKELYNIYQAQRIYDKTGFWFENEQQCRATFPCSYIPICYGPGADAVCDGETTPAGFKRIFVDLTVNETTTEE